MNGDDEAMAQLNIEIPEALKNRFTGLVKSRGRNVKGVLRTLVDEYVGHGATEPQPIYVCQEHSAFIEELAAILCDLDMGAPGPQVHYSYLVLALQQLKQIRDNQKKTIGLSQPA